jgi:hypothetical protein
MSKTFSVADVASHKDASSGMYIIVDENVYDVTSMLIFPLPWSLSPYCPIVTSPLHLSCPCAADLYPLPCFQSLLSKIPTSNVFGLRLKCQNRLRRRASRRSQDPQASRRQGRYQAILEISQRERVEEVRAEAEDWDGG